MERRNSRPLSLRFDIQATPALINTARLGFRVSLGYPTEEIMKTLTVFSLFLLILCLPMSALSQKESANLIKNGDFEKFTGDNPDGWDTSNIPGTLTVVSASKVVKSGTHSVKCEVKDFYGSVIAGYVCQKNIETGGKDVRITANFLVHSVDKDLGVLVLCFQNSGGSTVGTVEEYINDSNSKWVDLNKEFKSPAGSSSVHIRLTLLAGKNADKVHPGSYMICDDVKLVTITPAEKPLIQ
jgi:hypothetical protein